MGKTGDLGDLPRPMKEKKRGIFGGIVNLHNF